MTMTTSELTPEIEKKRARVRELTESRATLEKSLARTRNAIASARAASELPDPAGARESIRTNSEELEAAKGAIELLGREIAQLEGQRKQAEKREATERASQSVGVALSAIAAVDEAVREAAARILPLMSKARSAVGIANSDDINARSMNGEHVLSGMGRVTLANKPGLEDVVRSIDSYVHRQEVRVA